MPDYNLPHLDISYLATPTDYKSRNTAPRKTYGRTPNQHGIRIATELEAAFVEADQNRPRATQLPDGSNEPSGTYIRVELNEQAGHQDVERTSEKTRQSAEQLLENGRRSIVVVCP